MSNDDHTMAEYYGRRAPLYDEMYQHITPDTRTPMLSELIATVSGRVVLELACGPGFWTAWLAPHVASIHGVDIAPEMLDIARARPIEPGKASFSAGSVYDLTTLPATFTAAVALQWFSHVPLARHAEFFASMHGRLLPGARVFLADNIRRPDDDDPLIKQPGSDDTYELRTLPDGSQYHIVKNYFTPEQLLLAIPHEIDDVQAHFGQSWWWLTYTLE